MTASSLLDCAGRRRSPATLPGYHPRASAPISTRWPRPRNPCNWATFSAEVGRGSGRFASSRSPVRSRLAPSAKCLHVFAVSPDGQRASVVIRDELRHQRSA